jgi:hypothetical protein
MTLDRPHLAVELVGERAVGVLAWLDFERDEAAVVLLPIAHHHHVGQAGTRLHRSTRLTQHATP